jgi:hypothetical protein
VQSTVALIAIAPLGAPDSPVNYSVVRLEKPEGEELRSIHLGAPDTVRCARPGSSSVCFAPFF